VLASYAAVVLVGHSEYWTLGQRDQIERFVDGGGKLAIFSGNTAFWKVRFEDDGRRFICHKWSGFEADPVANERPEAATHLWSHRAFERPEAAITGLSFLFGGYHRLGLCVARGQGGYTVYDERHWALAGCQLAWIGVWTSMRLLQVPWRRSIERFPRCALPLSTITKTRCALL
jgi:hypothetical protein